VECGVDTGQISTSICEYIDFNATGRSFYLFDTFSGIPLNQCSSESEAATRAEINALHFTECYELACKNFSPFPNAKLIRGTVPETLGSAGIDRVCYLSIDMNLAYPERKAVEFFWPKLSTGAMVVLDDYGWLGGFEEQKKTMDDFAQSVGTEILTLPTGQGLLVKHSR
jgi:hypothetical protein